MRGIVRVEITLSHEMVTVVPLSSLSFWSLTSSSISFVNSLSIPVLCFCCEERGIVTCKLCEWDYNDWFSREISPLSVPFLMKHFLHSALIFIPITAIHLFFSLLVNGGLHSLNYSLFISISIFFLLSVPLKTAVRSSCFLQSRPWERKRGG